jgi:hypothetical protein
LRGVAYPPQQIFIHPFDVPKDLVVRITNELQAVGTQHSRPLTVILGRLGMAVAIYFDHQPKFRAVEIDDEVIDRLLPQKLELSELPFAQHLVPYSGFSRSRIAAVFSG